MGKIFLKLLYITLIILTLSIIFLTFIGIETSRLDALIKTNANQINKNVSLEFNKVKIYLNFINQSFLVKIKKPKVAIKNQKINLSKLDLFLSIKSFYSNDFLLKKIEIEFKKNNIKDITKITRIFIPKFINKRLNNIFAKGILEGEFSIPFEKDGKIGKEYKFFGRILNATINLSKDLSIQNLTSEINYDGEKNDQEYIFNINKGNFDNLNLQGSKITLNKEKNKIRFNTLLNTKGDIDFLKIKKVSNLLNLDLSIYKNIYGSIDLQTKIDANLGKNYKLSQLSYFSQGNILYLNIDTQNIESIKKYLPSYDNKINFKNTKIKFKKSKSGLTAALEGSLKISNEFDNFKINSKFDNNKKDYKIEGHFDLAKSKINIWQLNYKKDKNVDSSINFNTNFVANNFYNINELEFYEGNNKISLSNILFNKNYEIKNLDTVKVLTFNNKIKNNDFLIKKNKNIVIKGSIFDAHPLLKSLSKKNDSKIFSKKLSSEIKVDFKEVLTGTNDVVSNFATIASIKNGSFEKLILKGNFSKNEIIEMSIYKIDENQKTLQVISDRARPFIKNFNFIEGFERGKLEYESLISKNKSNSTLSITDFTVSKVPSLAKLLTLASLQGIADTLSGDGIRFDSFDMKLNSENNILNIEDALAMGPAISILLDGYVDKGRLVSLSGTLVPATKLNSLIAKIPFVGNILVGKKAGEGVVGVSFKMKGPPKNIKTTVNPIKTITPRFIVRALEKMKKEKN